MLTDKFFYDFTATVFGILVASGVIGGSLILFLSRALGSLYCTKSGIGFLFVSLLIISILLVRILILSKKKITPSGHNIPEEYDKI